ncbi:MAG: Trp biosynthesis-associated membrane protein [Blastococcus sp.]
MTARRELTTALLATVLAGALALSAGGQQWARVTVVRPLPLPPLAVVLTGAQAAPLVPATGLVLLAAAVALLAVRGVARMAVGLLMAVAGGTLGWSGVRALTGGLSAAATAMPTVGRGPVTVDVSAVWPVLAILAGALGVVAGLFVVVRGRDWPGMGRRYEREPGAAAPPRTDEDRAQAAWKALDRGEDPTADPTADTTDDPADGADLPPGRTPA